jgi:hypothetical protein
VFQSRRLLSLEELRLLKGRLLAAGCSATALQWRKLRESVLLSAEGIRDLEFLIDGSESVSSEGCITGVSHSGSVRGVGQV